MSHTDMFVSFKSDLSEREDKPDDLPSPFARPSFSSFCEVSQLLHDYVTRARADGALTVATYSLHDESDNVSDTPLGLRLGMRCARRAWPSPPSRWPWPQ